METKAKIICDSISQNGNRVTTFVCTFHRWILAEANTVRMFSRNSASSRAIPSTTIINNVKNNPAIPVHWGKLQKGMQAEEEINDEDKKNALNIWIKARDNAIKSVEKLLELGIHKQITNRLLEPWMWQTALISATEFENTFALRAHKDAQPEFQKLAYLMLDEYNKSQPKRLKKGEWHIPFGDKYCDDLSVEEQLKICTARAARVSYNNFEGDIDFEKDFKLHDNLLNSGHMCYSADTEVLTKSGWVKWPEVYNNKDDIASIDINTKEISFEQPSHWYKSEYNGQLYSVSGQAIDLLVTPNHNMVVAHRKNNGKWTEFYLKSAGEVGQNPVRYLKSGFLKERILVEDYKKFDFEMNKFAALLGFFLGDGGAYIGSDNCISFNIRLSRKIKFLLAISNAEMLPSKTWVVRKEGIGKWFRENCYDENKQKIMPNDYLRAIPEQIEYLLQGLKNSDGSLKRKTWHYDTTSFKLASQLQIILHLNNLVGSFSINEISKKNKNQKDCIRINIGHRVTPRVEPNQNGRSLTYNVFYQLYNGEIYCATVKTGAILIRRNNIVAVSGNSPFEHCAQNMEDSNYYGNFKGWKQYRKFFANENRNDPRVIKR